MIQLQIQVMFFFHMQENIIEILFNISDALGVEPSELLGMSVIPDSILSKKKN